MIIQTIHNIMVQILGLGVIKIDFCKALYCHIVKNTTNGWGRILVEAGKEEVVLLGEIDLNEANEIRQTGSILEDLRTDLY